MTKSPINNEGESCSSGVPLMAVGALGIIYGATRGSVVALALGITLLLTPATVYALLLWTLRRLRFSRNAPAQAFEGDEVEIAVTIENESPLPVFQPRLHEVFTPEIHEVKEILFPRRVRPDETVDAKYVGACLLPRGVYTLGPTTITVADPFGWFTASKIVRTTRKMKVYPRFENFGVKEREGASLSSAADRLAALGVGESNEIFSVREYRRGDPRRKIHWRLTAHRNEPVVREFARVSTGDFYIFLDLNRYALMGIGRGSSLEHSVKITAALSAHALRRGHRIQVIAPNARDRDGYVPMGCGTGHLAAILEFLVHVKPESESPLDKHLTRWLPRLSTGATVVIMVSDYLRERRRFEAQLRTLRMRGIRVILVVFDGGSFRNLYKESADTLERTRRSEDYTHHLRRLGAEAVLVPCASHLPSVFRAVS